MLNFLKRIFGMKSEAEKKFESVAHHEAGHAVVGIMLGHLIGEINVEPAVSGNSWTKKYYGLECDDIIKAVIARNPVGIASQMQIPQFDQCIQKYCIGLSAGYAAEEYFQTGRFSNSPYPASIDVSMINNALSALQIPSPNIVRANFEQRARNYLQKPGAWDAVILFARAIIAKNGHLLEHEAQDLMQQARVIIKNAHDSAK